MAQGGLLAVPEGEPSRGSGAEAFEYGAGCGDSSGMTRMEQLLMTMVAQNQNLHREIYDLKARVEKGEASRPADQEPGGGPVPKAPPAQAIPVPRVSMQAAEQRTSGGMMREMLRGTTGPVGHTTASAPTAASSWGTEGRGASREGQSKPPQGGPREAWGGTTPAGAAWMAAGWGQGWPGSEGREEGVRSIELPPLPGLAEGELGPLAAGDWLALITPMMKDLSGTSAQWWDGVMEESTRVYEQWLQSEPLTRLHLRPVLPPGCDRQPWARFEQRAQTMLLKALPEDMKSEAISSRSTTTVDLLFRILKKYQPGGLAERTHVLKQLVEGKSPNSIQDMVTQLQLWMRWFKRAKELRIDIPDATLLMGALDRLGQPLVRLSPQSAFRLSTVRAALQVDTMPTQDGARAFAETLLAEGEVAYHAGESKPTAKVKAAQLPERVERPERMERPERFEKPEAGDHRGDHGGKKGDGRRQTQPCKFFLTEEGCRRGANCSFAHEGEKAGRCWTCGSTKHMKKDCPTRSKSSEGGDRHKEQRPEIKGMKKEPEESQRSEAGVEEDGAASRAGATSSKGSDIGEEVGGLLREAAGLLRSLGGPTVKALNGPRDDEEIISLSILGKPDRRALLDGGATHCLRSSKGDEDWNSAEEVEVTLAAGSTTLRQLPASKTLLTREPVQPIVPLGILIEIGFTVTWEGRTFRIRDRSGNPLDARLEAGCPTVDEKTGPRADQDSGAADSGAEDEASGAPRRGGGAGEDRGPGEGGAGVAACPEGGIPRGPGTSSSKGSSIWEL